MTPNNAKIVKCPYCGAKKELMSLGSGNTFGAQYWSDLKVKAPMLPNISPVQKCAECGKYYLEYKQEASEGEKYSFEDGKLTYWEWKEAYGQLCDEGIDEEDLLNVRGWLVQSFNDFFYRGEEIIMPPQDECLFIKGVINELINTINWSETFDPLFPGGVSFGDPAQEELVWSSKLSPLLKAELYREAGEFQKCKELLLSFQGKSINTFDAQLCYGIKEQMEKGESAVFKFYDDREEEEKMRRERAAQKGFKQCSNGHYYQGDHCPFCRPDQKNKKAAPSPFVKVCDNHHVYITKLSKCPICGSTIVVDKYNWGTDTIDYRTICLINPILVKIKDRESSNISQIIVHFSRGNKYGYAFSDGCSSIQNNIDIEPDEDIQLGETIIKGKELMRMCDVILDNHLSFMVHNVEERTSLQKQELEGEKNNTGNSYRQCPNGHYYQGEECPYCKSTKGPLKTKNIKICPRGHGYSEEEQKCPFCDDDRVIRKMLFHNITEISAGFLYEKEGVQLPISEFEIDEQSMTGDNIHIRIHYTEYFKYDYGLSRGDSYVSVSPKSSVILKGDDFSDTFTGCEFYKMCDELFEKKK